MTDNYFQQFLDDEDMATAKSQPDQPSWVSAKNASLAAYEAIQTLYKIKKSYIKGHSREKDFKLKKHWAITKEEVAKEGCIPNAQPVFNNNAYSADLTAYIKTVNKDLKKKKEERLKNPRDLKAKKKADIMDELNTANNKIKKMEAVNIDELFTKTLNSLPLDVKRKLEL